MSAVGDTRDLGGMEQVHIGFCERCGKAVWRDRENPDPRPVHYRICVDEDPPIGRREAVRDERVRRNLLKAAEFYTDLICGPNPSPQFFMFVDALVLEALEGALMELEVPSAVEWEMGVEA